MIVNEATLRQIEAADPTANTWLSANAGSGKTRVLTDRVALLLLSGVSPQNILCLTYTKAAASEMQNRLFGRLGDWAMKPDDDLRADLQGLGVADVEDLSRARRLFAAAIETPGGLKIQTIHSFCAAILRRFPLEAGITPQFTEMDDRSASLLRESVLDDMASGPDRYLIENVAGFLTDTDFTRLTATICNSRSAFTTPVDAETVWSWFELSPGFDYPDVEATAFKPGDGDLLDAITPYFLRGSSTDEKNGNRLLQIDSSGLSLSDLEILKGVCLTGSSAKEPFSAKIGSVPTKNTRDSAEHLMPAFEDLMQRIEAAWRAKLTLDAARKTLAIHAFARAFLTRYQSRKQARGWLDFDDLITIAGRLLNDPAVASWVLFRLDGGIDHILVDEAQDTSPAQWRVIESLAREFTVGESARSHLPRTIFVVGDLKQSIYSFQGADPSGFTRMMNEFQTAFEVVGKKVFPLELEYSFRSSWAILGFVDNTLESAPGLGQRVKHLSLDLERPGRVDLWPVVQAPENPPDKAWSDPVDVPAPEDARLKLANSVADAISDMLETGMIPDREGGWRHIKPGDVMVLVRRRSVIFHEIIRACKARGLPIAGADRLRIGGELAVKDLTAVLAFLATPEDDLSLAAALRSPLCGLTENDLFNLAHNRGKRYLWNVLRERSDAFPAVLAMLGDLRDEADFLRPYDLIDRILTRHNGRHRLVARLGTEAEDGIDALLAQALAYEQIEVPSLTGFLSWLAAEEVEIKRQMDSAGDRIRVMTVHGAKGLEAPVVILPETAKSTSRNRDKLIETDAGIVWRSGKEEAPELVRAAMDLEKELDEEENMRLFYVAMTRAESWLVIAAAGDVGNENSSESWYRIAEEGMRNSKAVCFDFALGEGLRHEIGSWVRSGHSERDHTTRSGETGVPGWLTSHAAPPVAAPPVLVPSSLGGAKIVGEPLEVDASAKDAALRHGRQIHRLFEFLPAYERARWPEVARNLLAFGEDAASEEEVAELLDEVRPVLEAPDLAPLFAPDALAEVEISAPVDLPGAERIHGVIDRLIVSSETVLAVDFKTNRLVPDNPEDVPEGLLRQMGAYEIALRTVFPNHNIVTALLWTRTAKLMKLPDGLSLRAFGRLDGSRPGS